MAKNMRWAAIICLLLLPAVDRGHELNFEGKTFTELRQWCFGNLNGYEEGGTEMIVDAEDVLALVAQFGATCPEECEYPCPEARNFDLNHNHVVGEGDLRVLLGNWGPCRDRADVNGGGDVDHDDAVAVADDIDLLEPLDCQPDLDFSGGVEGNDLNLAQLAWGPGDDHQGDVDRDGYLEIADDLLAVVNSLGRGCTSDVDFNGTVDCEDLECICDGAFDCCDIGPATCPALMWDCPQ